MAMMSPHISRSPKTVAKEMKSILELDCDKRAKIVLEHGKDIANFQI